MLIRCQDLEMAFKTAGYGQGTQRRQATSTQRCENALVNSRWTMLDHSTPEKAIHVHIPSERGNTADCLLASLCPGPFKAVSLDNS
jgi:hypothetical protein